MKIELDLNEDQLEEIVRQMEAAVRDVKDEVVPLADGDIENLEEADERVNRANELMGRVLDIAEEFIVPLERARRVIAQARA